MSEPHIARSSSMSPLSWWGELLVTSFGLGHLRPAPGTWGSMPTVALAGAMIAAGVSPVPGTGAWWVYHAVLLATLVFFSAACVRFGEEAEARFNRKDPSSVVADETAGQCFALMFLPTTAFASWGHLLVTLGLAFVTFRVLDVFKPWPARGLQRCPAGWGILLDDLTSGVQALVVVQLVTRLVW